MGAVLTNNRHGLLLQPWHDLRSPPTALLAFVWLYLDIRDPDKVASLSQGIFWLVTPSLLMFVVLPILLRVGLNFWLSLASSCTLTALAYALVTWVLKKAGIPI